MPQRSSLYSKNPQMPIVKCIIFNLAFPNVFQKKEKRVSSRDIYPYQS